MFMETIRVKLGYRVLNLLLFLSFAGGFLFVSCQTFSEQVVFKKKTESKYNFFSSRHKFIWPLKNVEITSNYGRRWERPHNGIDLRAPIGTSIYASSEGRVVNAGYQSGYGLTVIIQNKEKIQTLYAHCQRLFVKNGYWIDQGDLIAYVGITGKTTGPHLHFEIRDSKGRSFDPLNLLPKQ